MLSDPMLLLFLKAAVPDQIMFLSLFTLLLLLPPLLR
jgi:hypothetical protein